MQLNNFLDDMTIYGHAEFPVEIILKSPQGISADNVHLYILTGTFGYTREYNSKSYIAPGFRQNSSPTHIGPQWLDMTQPAWQQIISSKLIMDLILSTTSAISSSDVVGG